MDTSTLMSGSKTRRIISLDVMRGVVIALMIMVNNNGSRAAYRQMKHSVWNGWTLTDLVFPSFLLMVGTTIVFSTEARLAKGTTRREILLHILQRALVLFCLGIIVNGFPSFPLATLRIYGVLQRIALCYFVVSILYLLSRRVMTFVCVTIGALTAYYILMRWVPLPGFGVPGRDIPFLDPYCNWVAVVDRAIFPHRLNDHVRDPEGLLSTLPAIGTTCIGVLTALWLRLQGTAARKTAGLLVGAVVGIVAGEFWNIWFPINKNLWTSSYVLFAAGCTLLVFSLCYMLLDAKRWRGWWTFPMVVFGSNAITAYMVSELLAETLQAIHLQCGGKLLTLKGCIYARFFAHLVNPAFGSLLYSLSFVSICFIPNLLLYRKRIFLKV